MANDFDEFLRFNAAGGEPTPTGPAQPMQPGAGQFPVGLTPTEPAPAWQSAEGQDAGEDSSAEQPASKRGAKGRASAKKASGRSRGNDAGEAGIAAAEGDAAKDAGGGFFTRHRKVLAAIGLPLAAVLVAGGALVGGYAVGSTPPPAASPGDVAQDARPLPEAIGAPVLLRTCSIDPLVTDSALGTFSGSVVDTATGEVLFSRSADVAATPGSLQLLLTGAAAIAVLGADHRFTTTVVEGTTPGTIVLVGGGDPTLSRVASGNSVYSGAPKLSALAQEAKAAYLNGTAENDPDSGIQPIRTVLLDTTLWDSSDAQNWHSDWPSNARSKGQLSRITALTADGDRNDPRSRGSARGNNPVQRAGDAFTGFLNLQPTQEELDEEALDPENGGMSVTVTTGTANSSARVLASVQSPRVEALVNHMLRYDDYTLAEYLGRHIALNTNRHGTFAETGLAVRAGLQSIGVDTVGTELVDASGFSAKNLVTPGTFTSLLTTLETRSAGDPLLTVSNAMGKAAESGSLAKRFTAGSQSALKGRLRGEASNATGVSTVTAVLQAEDNSVFSLTFFAHGSTGKDVTAKLDAAVNAVYACGANLSQY